MKIHPAADAPKFVKDIDPGVIFYLTHKAEKCLVWKGREAGTEYAYLVFATPFMDAPAFELVDAAHLENAIGIPCSDAMLLPKSGAFEPMRPSEAKKGTLLISVTDAGLIVKKGHHPFLLSFEQGRLIQANSAEAWMGYPTWDIVRPVDPKAAEKWASILAFPTTT